MRWIQNRAKHILHLAMGLTIVPLLIIGFFGNIKSVNSNKDENGLLVYANETGQPFILKLEDKMEFYWNQLLDPTDFKNDLLVKRQDTSYFPKTWNGKIIDGQKLPGRGFATYRTQLYFDTICPMAIRINDYCNSYKLWMNGTLISQAGIPGKNVKETVPVKVNSLIIFTPHEGANELIIQTANFNEKYGGFRQPFLIGTADKVNTVHIKRQVIDSFLLGLILFAFLYHIEFYLFNPHRKSFLYFAIFVFLMLVRQTLLSNISILDPFLQKNISLYLKTSVFAVWLASLIILLFFEEFFQKGIPKKILKIYSVWIILFCGFIVIAPYYYVSVAAHFSQFTLIFALLYLVYLLFTSIDKNEQVEIKITVGIVSFIVFVLIEALIFNRLLYSVYTLQFGLAFFIIFESYALGLDFSKTYQSNLALAKELDVQNKNLRDLVKEKTKEVLEAKEREIVSTLVQKSKTDLLLKNFTERLNKLKLENKDEQREITDIIKTSDHTITNDETDKYLLHFRKVYPQFIEGLQKNHPSLTQNELKLCGYLKINLSNKEIANILHVQPESVRKSITRMRKKMGLRSNKEITSYFNQF